MVVLTLRPWPLLALALLALASLPLAALAGPLVLNLPQPASQTVQAVSEVGDLLLPSGAFAGGAIPGTRLPGRVSQTAWRIDQPLATVDLMGRLKADVLAAGFTTTLDCQTEVCGGFDFRYAITALPEPDMHVDLGDFRFLAARRGDEGVTLLVSRSKQAAYVQITLVGPQVAAPVALADASAAAGVDATGVSTGDGAGTASANGTATISVPPAPATGLEIGSALEGQGHAVLDGLIFGSGKGQLQARDYPVLAALAAWLIANPEAKVVLVGHTDATGGAAGNLALSRARAQSVRQALVALGVPGGQITADGVGYLAPRASSLTDAGRVQNRRVEVVLTSTQLPASTMKP